MKSIHAVMALVASLPVATAMLALTACRIPTPIEPDVIIVVSPDAHPHLIDAADPCASACDNLAALGCQDGIDPGCVSACRHVLSTHMTKLDTMCLTSAHSKSAAVACGGVACLP